MLEYLKATATERVKERGDQFSGRYAEHGFWSNPFEGSENSMQANYELYTARKAELKELTNLLVDSLTGIGTDVAIVGPLGSGARSTANLLAHFLANIDDETPTLTLLRERVASIIDTPASAFTTELRESAKRNIMSALKQGKLTIMTTNFFGLTYYSPNMHEESTIETIRKLLEFDSMSSDKVIYLTPWNTTAWKHLAEESPTLSGVYETVIELKPLTEKQIVSLLKERMRFYALEGRKTTFTEEILTSIAKHTGGLPRFALEAAEKILERAVEKKIKPQQAAKHFLSEEKSYEELASTIKKLIPPPKPWHKKEHTIKRILNAIILLGG
ncbi:hypothetical protein GOV10_01455, partial [Candidatus Woesearchaeota archaeon]|nr:hypothetical protein [Candidatus Woesearchaeota archaeon]